ncbi:MAG TPA: hypothetical protein ENG98_04520 [Actinobacteria bacterium]|nr:hypothetical protein [Actinomycetota bacterium]
MQHTDVERCEQLIGRTLSETQKSQLRSYADWLADEALVAGGIGPREVDRLWDRHILDSAAFRVVLPADGATGAPIVDIGSGVGLPGIVLAILLPSTSVTLLDRSGRRHTLQKRALRILELTNCVAVQQDIPEQPIPHGIRVFRASLTAQEVLSLQASYPYHSASILALTRRMDSAIPETLAAEAARVGVGVRLERVGADVLDSPASFLIMTSLEQVEEQGFSWQRRQRRS